jgi:hypothetical protein
VVFAQTPPLDIGDALHIDLTAAQKQTVYQSVSKAQKNNAPQRAFRATVGPLVPTGRDLAPVPATIADLMPQGAGIRHGRGPSWCWSTPIDDRAEGTGAGAGIGAVVGGGAGLLAGLGLLAIPGLGPVVGGTAGGLIGALTMCAQ